MGWIDNYWISWRYHLHGWHTPDVPHLKGFTHWQWVIQANQRNIIPFPILNTAPETTVGILHIFGTIEWGCLILGGWDWKKKSHLVFHVFFFEHLQKSSATSAWAGLHSHSWGMATLNACEQIKSRLQLEPETCETCRREVKPSPKCRNRNDVTTLIYIYIHIYIYIYIVI